MEEYGIPPREKYELELISSTVALIPIVQYHAYKTTLFQLSSSSLSGKLFLVVVYAPYPSNRHFHRVHSPCCSRTS
jgi:hypothetical protein